MPRVVPLMTKVRGPRLGHKWETRRRWIFKSNRMGRRTEVLDYDCVFTILTEWDSPSGKISSVNRAVEPIPSLPRWWWEMP